MNGIFSGKLVPLFALFNGVPHILRTVEIYFRQPLAVIESQLADAFYRTRQGQFTKTAALPKGISRNGNGSLLDRDVSACEKICLYQVISDIKNSVLPVLLILIA